MRILNSDSKRKDGGRNVLSAEIGARIAKSMVFWGLAAILASSAYTGIVKIEQGVGGSKESPVNAMAEDAEGSINAAAEDAEGSINAAAEDAEDPINAAAKEGQKPANVAANGVEEAVDMGEPKRVAITFDDGPHRVYTKELLDGLAERNVHATFFVVGKNIVGNEELIERMDQEGHLIGNHTYDHVKICDMSGEDACEQVEKTSALVREITGHDTEFVRPPFGAWNKSMECSFVMIPVLWNVDPLDWTTKNTDLVVQRVLDDVENGDIILLHDFYESSVEAALQIIDKLLEQGYEFVTVDELILE